MIIAGIIIGIIVLLLIIFFSTYTVVNPNEAHVVVVMGAGRKIYSPNIRDDGKKQSTAYFYFPFLMRREILPLANVKMEIPKFKLNDAEVAPFVCEVTCWLRIIDPDIAIEKLDIRNGDFEEAVRSTLEEQIRGIARASAMNQEILEIMRDRKTFANLVESEVNGSLDEWGLKLTRLEIVDIYDSEGSTVIADYENKRQETIRTESRKVIAKQRKEAEIEEANAQKEAGVAKQQAEQIVEQARIEKEKSVEVSKQEAQLIVEEKRNKTNAKTVEANRTLDVGNAQVKKEALIEEATGKAEAIKKEGQAEADVTEAKGTADANVVKKTGTAEAEVIKEKGFAKAASIDKEADALKKYNDSGLAVETIRATVEVEKTKYMSMAEALKNANINLVQGGVQDVFGMPVGPEQGAGMAQTILSFAKTAGIDLTKVFGNKAEESVKKPKKK